MSLLCRCPLVNVGVIGNRSFSTILNTRQSFLAYQQQVDDTIVTDRQSVPSPVASAATDPLPKQSDDTDQLAQLFAPNPFLSSLHQSIQQRTRQRCYNCGMFGHQARDCLAIAMRKACFNCGSAGHISKECKEVAKPVYCFRCRTPGHHSNECTKPLRVELGHTE